MWKGEVLKAFFTPPSFRYCVNCDGLCCLGNAALQSPHWSQGTERADTTGLSGSISGAGKSIEIRLRMRASSVPTLCARCLTKRSCHFLFGARVGLCC